MEDRGLDTARAKFLEQVGRFTEAAQIYQDEGQTVKAISVLLKDSHKPDAAERASLSLLEGLRRRLSFGSSVRPQVLRSDAVLSALCGMLHSKDLMGRLGDTIRNEVSHLSSLASVLPMTSPTLVVHVPRDRVGEQYFIRALQIEQAPPQTKRPT